jgi:hypothetical protein
MMSLLIVEQQILGSFEILFHTTTREIIFGPPSWYAAFAGSAQTGYIAISMALQPQREFLTRFRRVLGPIKFEDNNTSGIRLR